MVHDPNPLSQVRSSRELSIVSVVSIPMLIISSIWFMIDLSVSCVPRPCLHMLGSSSLTRVFRACNYFAPVVCERWVYHVVSRNEELSQRCTVGENTISSWNFSDRSPYNAIVVLSKIRCIKGLTSHAIHKWHDMAIILCFLISITKAPTWSSCHRRHTMISINVSPSRLSCYLCYYY